MNILQIRIGINIKNALNLNNDISICNRKSERKVSIKYRNDKIWKDDKSELRTQILIDIKNPGNIYPRKSLSAPKIIHPGKITPNFNPEIDIVGICPYYHINVTPKMRVA